jgi:type III pantothenate kinase
VNASAQLPTLLVDLGNSRLKWAWLEGRQADATAALSHRAQDLSRQLDASWGRMPAPARVVLASVADGQRSEAFEAWVQGRWGLSVDRVFSGAQALGVTNAYPEPRQLGVDRWLALIAVHRRFSGPACIVDCGSAITIDGLAPDGRHLGGLILPGLALMRAALLRGTGLEDLSPPPEPRWLACDTAGAIGYGGLLACVALVERLAARIEEECARVPEIILSGGDGARLQPLLEPASRYEGNLVLSGLAAIAGEVES